jgi:fatty-acyl-CoA synthase
MKVVDDDGNELPHDGSSAGAVMVRGPWVIERYYQQESTALDAKGWFDTGDIATIDANGFMRITDRKKDVIKSGGEWISSIDIENIAVACPGVKFAAVVGVFHPKWEERPVLVVESHADSDLTIEDVLDWIRPKLVKWWLPDRILLDEVPLTSTGKLDKKVIRQKYADILRDI